MSSTSPTPKPTAGLLALCVLLWLAALIFTGISVFLLQHGETASGIVGLAAAVLAAAAGVGILKMRRWGAILFGLLAALGSVNHLANTFQRYNDLSNASLGTVLAALLSITVAILIPAGLFYMTLMLWRQAR